MKKDHMTPVECSKLFAVPKDFTFTHLYGREGRYLQDHARHLGIRMDYNQVNGTIKISGHYEFVDQFSDFLRRYISSCEMENQKRNSKRSKMFYYVLDGQSELFLCDEYKNAETLSKLSFKPYVLKRCPECMQEKSLPAPPEAVSSKIGHSIENRSHLVAVAKAFEMVSFSESLNASAASDSSTTNDGQSQKQASGLQLRFRLGKQLFFPPKYPSSVHVMFPVDADDRSPIHISSLRLLKEGANEDFRQMFWPSLQIETSEIIKDRLLMNGFEPKDNIQFLKIRVYDLIDKAFLDIKYKLSQSADGGDCTSELLWMAPSFQKHDSLTIISIASAKLPDFRLELRDVVYYGPNHPASIFAWPFASSLKWDEENQKIVKGSSEQMPWTRYEINMWERITTQTFASDDGRYEVFISDINEDNGDYKCTVSGTHVGLQNKLTKGVKISHKELLRMIESLKELISP